MCIYSGYVIKRPEIVKNGRLGEKSGYRGEILPEECPQKIGCSFCTEDYDYVEDAAAVEQLWQEFIQLSGKVTSDPIPPEEMVEGVGYFQFVYADGETRTFRYASEGLLI